MLKFAAPLLATIAVALTSTSALAAREDQWVARGELGDRSRGPAAVFLSWDYGAVIFRATCDHGELVLDYFGDGESSQPRAASMAIRGALLVMLRTRLVDGHLQGRVKVTKSVLQSLAAPGALEIDAPNDMGEAWHVGQAEPLRLLARHCT